MAAVSDGIADIADGLVAMGAPDAVIEGFERFVDGLRGLLAVNIAALAGTAVTVGTILVLAAFLLYFVLQDGDRGWAWFMGQLEPKQASTLTAGATVGVERVGGYVRRVVVMAAADAVVAAVLLLLLGGSGLGPLLGPLVALVFVGGLVPYIGAIVTTSAIALILVAVAGPLQALLFVAGLAVAAIAEDRVLADTPIGRRVNVHPAIVVIAITAGAALYGILGLITALPVTVFVARRHRIGHRGPRRSARERRPCRRSPRPPGPCRSGSTASPSGAGAASSRSGSRCSPSGSSCRSPSSPCRSSSRS